MSDLQSSKVFTYTVKRRYLRVSGSDALRFLNGMWTCDLKRATTSKVPSTGAGFLLTNKGKAITEAVFVALSTTEFLISIPEADAQSVHDSLNKYLIADDVTLSFDENYEGTLVVPDSMMEPNAYSQRQSSSVPLAKDEIFKAQLCEWGLRIPRAQLGPTHEEWWILKGSNAPMQTVELSESQFTALRIEKGLPLWGVDLMTESFPLEFPAASEISFFKGCYIGQEVIARATFRGHVTRVFARFYSATPLKTDLIYSQSEPDRAIGKITSVSGGLGLGLIRVNALDNPNELFQKDGYGQISFYKIEALVDENTYKSVG